VDHQPALSRRAAVFAALFGLTAALTGAAEVDDLRKDAMRRLRQLLAPGDLVFRSGTSLESSAVLSARINSQFSHVGVAAFGGGELGVVSALPADRQFPGGVVWSDWDGYSLAEDVARVAIYRVTGASSADQLRIAATAMSLLGRPFDNGYRLRQTGRLYCTKVALQAVASVAPDILRAVRAQEIYFFDEPVYTPDSLLSWDRLVPIT
jgi:permuted papain-like amidase YaeF/Yiix C92 family enzyme